MTGAAAGVSATGGITIVGVAAGATVGASAWLIDWARAGVETSASMAEIAIVARGDSDAVLFMTIEAAGQSQRSVLCDETIVFQRRFVFFWCSVVVDQYFNGIGYDIHSYGIH
jgi:hypothetical protein